jgi:SAM-dependent methyltransferase
MGAAEVVSFDYDADSVATTERVRDWAGAGANWRVMRGSVLDAGFMAGLGAFDLVYSWGVLHHTGSMWEAVRNAGRPLKPGGEFYIALYSTENYVDPPPAYWAALKRDYNRASPLARKLMEMRYLHWRVIEPDIVAGRGPLATVNAYGNRGMTAWTDVKDWLGGYPIEFAGLAETRDFCRREFGLDLVNVLAGEGCTEYLFTDMSRNPKWSAIEKGRVKTPLAPPFEPVRGFAYRAALPEALAPLGDVDGDHMRSPVMLYEDGEALGLAHANRDIICDFGGGRFRHDGAALIFSARDGSDPNVNGRAYAYCPAY